MGIYLKVGVLVSPLIVMEIDERTNRSEPEIGFSSAASNRIGHREVGEKGPLEMILEAINM